MALPTLADKIDAVEDKLEKESIISEIANAVFRSAKISTEAVAKFAVVPSVPQMVDDILEDLKSGSVLKFNQAMDKLDKLVRTLGVDLKKYNKELANFAARREEKIIKSEEKIQSLKEKNIIAEIEKTGDIKILSNREIEARKDNLDILERDIKKLEKTLEKDRKVLQESDKLKTRAQSNKKEEVIQNTAKLDEMKKTRDKEKEVLGERGEEQPGIIQRISGGLDNAAEYIPDQLLEIGSAMKEGFMAPFTAIQELGMQFGQLLKPLKLLKPLFGGLIRGLKRFAGGLKASVIAFLPYLAIGALVIGALTALYLAFQKAKDFFSIKKDGPSESGLGGSQDTDLPEDVPVAEEGDMSSRVQRRSFVFGDTLGEKRVIMPDDPDYDKLYMQQFGKEAPQEGQVYMGEGKSAILPLDKEGFVNPFEMRNKPPVLFDNPLKDLAPVEQKETGGTANVNNLNTVSNVNNANYTSAGLNGANNRDLDAFALAQKYVSV